jgi:hypothetical protein
VHETKFNERRGPDDFQATPFANLAYDFFKTSSKTAAFYRMQYMSWHGENSSARSSAGAATTASGRRLMMSWQLMRPRGIDIKPLSGMLGHYSAGFALDTYTHITTKMQREAAEKMGGFMSHLCFSNRSE